MQKTSIILAFVFLHFACSNTLFNKSYIKGKYEFKEKKLSNELLSDKCLIVGHIKDRETGTFLSGASVSIDRKDIGTQTDSLGFFSLEVVPGIYKLRASYTGNTNLLTKGINLKERETLELILYLGTFYN